MSKSLILRNEQKNMSLKGKKILLGITGSIAAYKAALLTRLFIKAGAEVQVIMTDAATKFITPLTLSTLSKKTVYTQVIDQDSWNNHVELGLWADAMIVAPATANTLSKMASGMSDNMITAIYLSARCPVFFAPAMDLDMWKHPATMENVRRLQQYGHLLIPVEYGELASGLLGDGRMAEPQNIVNFVKQYFEQTLDLKNKNVLITAGPTYEAIDPVRFIGNRSSGKMGIAIAEVCAARGANVHLILGPTHLSVNNPNIQITKIESAQEMYEEATAHFAKTDIAILAAAVADYRPATIAKEKIKKKTEQLNLVLEKTLDIAAALGKLKKQQQMIIGFALETNNEQANAEKKLLKKNFDFIVLNSLKDKGAGFNHDTNKVKIIHRKGNSNSYPLKSKKEVAIDIINEIVALLNK